MKRHLLRGLVLAFLLGPLSVGITTLPTNAASVPPIGCPGGPPGPPAPGANYPCPDGGQVINGTYYPPNTGRITLTVTYKDGTQVGHCPNTQVYIRRVSGANVGPGSVTTTTSGGINIDGLGPGQVALTVNECIGDNNGKTYHGESSAITIEAGKTVNFTFTLTQAGAAEATAACDAGGFTWLLCPVIKLAQKGIMWFQGVIANLLISQPLNDQNPEGKALKTLWSAVRNIANVFFVLIFFVIIFGTAIGIDNYTVKKMLPRLIAAAVLIQFSYLLMGFAIDLSNVAAAGIKTLGALVPGTSQSNNIGTGEWAAGLGLLSLGVSAVIGLELIVPVMLVIVSALLSFLTIWIALEFRHILIDFLVVVAPIAIVLWTLPNTKKFADKWWELFGGLLMIQPVIIGVFVVANLLSSVIAQANTNSVTASLTASIIPIIAGFSVGALVANGPKWFTKGVGMIGGFTGMGNKSLEGYGKRKAEERQEKGLQKLNKLGGAQATGLRAALARKQAGFSFRAPSLSTPQGRRLGSSTEKALRDQIAVENTEMSKLNWGNADHLAIMTAAAMDSKDQAKQISAIQRLSMTASGRRELIKVKEALGGDDMSVAQPQNYKAWQMGTEKLDRAAAPDLVKPATAAFSGVSAKELANFDPSTAERAIAHWTQLSRTRASIDVSTEEGRTAAARIDNTLAQAANAIRGIESTPQLRTQIEPDAFAAFQTWTQTARPAAPTAAAPAQPTPPPTPPVGPANVTVNVPRYPTAPGPSTTPSTWQQRPSGLVIPGQPPAPGTTFHPAVDLVVEEAQDNTQDPRAIN